MFLHISILVSLFFAALALCAPCASAQVMPLSDVTIGWMDLPQTVEPELDTKASRCAFAVRHDVAEGVESAAEVALLADGSVVWALGFRSPGALSMSLELDGSIPSGGSLSVLDSLGGQARQVTLSHGFTPIIFADHIVLQYVGVGDSLPQIHVTAAFGGFRKIGALPSASTESHNKVLNFGDSQSCEVNVSCSENAATQKRSVCRLLLNGVNVGTGTLINNTSQDHDPLVLTSAHVLGSKAVTLKSCVALFGFEQALCSDGDIYSSGTEEIEGGTLVACDAGTDMAVIRLSATPSVVSRPYWSGWSRELSADGDVFCVHHPYGDVKKVSTSTFASPCNNYSTTDKNVAGGAFTKGVFWRISDWTSGTTEGGSSGSGLVNSENLLIGALSGGEATCSKPRNDYFWMVAKAWDASSNDYSTLGDVLDPQGLDVEQLEGVSGLEPEGDSEINVGQTFNPCEDEFAQSDLLGSYRTAMAQLFSLETQSGKAVTIWAVRLYVSDVTDYSSSGLSLSVSVCSDLSSTPQGETQVSLSSVGDNHVVDCVLSSPVTIKSGCNAYIRVEVLNCGSSDGVKLCMVSSSDDVAKVEADREWTDVDGEKMAMDVIYSYTSGTSSRTVTDASVSMRAQDDVATFFGEPISSVALFDRGGRMVEYVAADGRTEVSIDLCPKSTGLYFARVLASSGRQKTFKLLNL